MNTLERFLIQASGAEKSILEKPECATERGKYAMIGASVVANGLLASLSGGYALFTVFKSIPLAFSLGGLYGGLIFNIDRFFVATTRKEKKPSASYYATLGIRCFLAMSIGFVIAKPLELKIFHKPIMVRLDKENLKLAQQTEAQLNLNFAELDDLKQQRQVIIDEIQHKEKRRDQAFSEAMAENEGSKGTLKPGKGPVFEEKFTEYKQLDQDYQQFSQKSQETLNQLNLRIADLTHQKDAELAKVKANQTDNDSLMTQLDILHILGKEKPVLGQASWAITLLFIALDTAPILAKFLLKRGIYDAIIDRTETEKMEEQEQYLAISKLKQEFDFEQYQQALKATYKHPKQAEIIEELAAKIVENSRHQLMSYVNQYRYPDAEVIRQVKEAYHQEIKEWIQEEVKRRMVETRANNSFEAILQEIRQQMNGLTENNHHF